MIEGTSTAGFPDVETHSLVVMPDYPDNIWVGTNIGIVGTTDREQVKYYTLCNIQFPSCNSLGYEN